MRRDRLLRQTLVMLCVLLATYLASEGRALAEECGKHLYRSEVVYLLRTGGFSGWLEGDPLVGDRVLSEPLINRRQESI